MKKLILAFLLLCSLAGVCQTFSGSSGSDIFFLPPWRTCWGTDNVNAVCGILYAPQWVRLTGGWDFVIVGRTVAQLPNALLNTGRIYRVTDGQSTSDCTAGGGTSMTICVSNGVIWQALGGGGGGGSGTVACGSFVSGQLGAFNLSNSVTCDVNSFTDFNGNLRSQTYKAVGPANGIIEWIGGGSDPTTNPSTNAIDLLAPATVATPFYLRWPNTSGTTNQVLGITSQSTLPSGAVISNLGYVTQATGTVTSVGQTVNGSGSSGIFTITGSPVTGSGTLNINLSGTSGGALCFTSGTVVSSGSLLSLNTLTKGGGAGACPTNSQVTDDGVLPTRSPLGFNAAGAADYFEVANNAVTGTQNQTLSCNDGSAKAIICPHTSSTANVPFGATFAGGGTTGSATICVIGHCVVKFDNQTVIGDQAIASTTTDGFLHDTGGTGLTANQPNYYVESVNSGAGTTAQYQMLTPDQVTGGGQFATKAGVQQEAYVCANDTGAANAYAIALSPTPTIGKYSFACFQATHTNTTASTLNVNSGGAVAIKKWSGGSLVALVAGDITLNQIINVTYDGTQWVMDAPPSFTLPTQYTKLRCETGLGDGLNAMAAGTYLQTMCYNDSGVTWTITGIKCFTDNNGTSTLNATDSSASGLLTGAITCTNSFASGTQSGTTTISNGGYVKFTFVGDGTSKQTTWVVSFTQ